MKNYGKRIIALLMLFSMALFAVPVSAAPSQPAVRSGLSYDTEGIADIAPYKSVFYLPSSIDVTAVKFDTDNKTFVYDGSSTETAFPDDHVIDLTPGETTDIYGNTCYKIAVNGVTYTFYSAGSIGAVYVSTSHGVEYLRSGKENRDKESKIIIADVSGKALYDDVSNDTLSEIKGRGNASYANEKKPFQIKLGKKTDLFGMGKSKTWILLANYNDASYMRNTCAFKIAEALELPYTPKSVFVDLYIDNEYQGIYQLSEKTQIGTNRIEIEDLEELNEKANSNVDLDTLEINWSSVGEGDSGNLDWFRYGDGMIDPDDITGGYLIELDNLYSGSEKSVFRTRNENEYTVKSPEVASEAEMRYISNLFGRFEQALYSDTGYDENGVYYTEYCDLESLVKVYIVEEITKNWDAYIGSVFFYKDADKDGETAKIYAGPVWDFDNTWGNISGRGTFATDLTEVWADGVNNNGGFSYKQDFGAALMQHEDARELAATLYSKAAYCVEEMLSDEGLIEDLTFEISGSAHMDMSRWPISRRNQTFIYFNKYLDETTDSAVGYLRNFMTVRTEALYEAFGAEHIEHAEATHKHTLERIEGKAPTCTESGTEAYWKCAECGKIYSDDKGETRIYKPAVIKATGHTAGDPVIENVVKATCEAGGRYDRVKYCTACGAEMSRVAFTENAIGHDFGAWTVTKAATAYEDGIETRVCKNDASHVETRTIPKTGEETSATETVAETEPPTETESTAQTETEGVIQTESATQASTESASSEGQATSPQGSDGTAKTEDTGAESESQAAEQPITKQYIKYIVIGIAAVVVIVLIIAVAIKKKN